MLPFCDFLSSDACEAMKMAAAATEMGLRLYSSKVQQVNLHSSNIRQGPNYKNILRFLVRLS